MNNRTDIKQCDVFVSWTSADREIKNKIVEFLTQKGISCLESDESCSGDYRQWSREAVGACSVFLPILTEHVKDSVYMPIEMQEAKLLDDYKNRIVPFCENKEIYSAFSFGLNKFCSAVFCEGMFKIGDLDKLYNKINSLLINRYFPIYKQAIKPTFIRLIPLLKEIDNIKTKNVSFENLYVPRNIIDYDESGEIKNTYSNFNVLTIPGRISFVYGPAGSGKTQYLNYVASNIDDAYLALIVSCQKFNDFNGTLYDYIYEHFYDTIGREKPYSKENFARLIASKKLLLIFDGMDEIAEESATRRLICKIEELYKVVQDKSAMVFTSRNKQDVNHIAFCNKSTNIYELQKLSNEGIERISNNIFALIDQGENINSFIDAVKELDDEIKFNPLLLTQLVIIYMVSGKIPTTSFGILDAVVDIILRTDEEKGVSNTDFLRNIRKFLKDFSRERYELGSKGRTIDDVKVFKAILKKQYYDYEIKASFLVDYLKNRAILVDGQFYHKMLMEYFTAVSFYDDIFNTYDELENEQLLTELLTHYGDSYWSNVIKLFLVKADTLIDATETEKLYRKVIELGNVLDYELLFDACCDLNKQKQTAQITLVKDILYKSAEKIYPPYGPLFYYVPQYELYNQAINAAKKLKGNARALALVRDVCFIFGQFDEVGQVTNNVDGVELYNAAKHQLSGVRNALCELFFTGNTDFKGDNNIYPRCFNVESVKNFKNYNCDLWKSLTVEYNDELSLFEHEQYSELNGEYIGIIFCEHQKKFFCNKLRQKVYEKVTGIIFLSSFDEIVSYFPLYRKKLKYILWPENCSVMRYDYNLHLDNLLLTNHFDAGIAYFRINAIISFYNEREVIPSKILKCIKGASHITFLDGIKYIQSNNIPRKCLSMQLPKTIEKACLWGNDETSIIVPNELETTKIIGQNEKARRSIECFDQPILGMKTLSFKSFYNKIDTSKESIVRVATNIQAYQFFGKKNILNVEVARKVKRIGRFAFANCENLITVVLPLKIHKIEEGSFQNCVRLNDILMPQYLQFIEPFAFENCGFDRIFLPESLLEIKEGAFKDCKNLKKIFIPNNVRAIHKDAFYGCSNLQKIVIPSNIEYISKDAFRGCHIRHCIGPENFKIEEEYSNIKESSKILVETKDESDILTIDKFEGFKGQIIINDVPLCFEELVNLKKLQPEIIQNVKMNGDIPLCFA